MYNKFEIINPEAVLQAFTDFECGKTYAIEIKSKDFNTLQREIKPLPGYEPPVNKETGAKFPFCCENHKAIFQMAKDYYDRFPDCCEWHKNLLTANWFDKKNYAYVPFKVVNTIQYTFHCISKCIENDNWYNEITDYISEIIKSYGHPPDGFGEPVGLNIYLPTIENNLKVLKEIPENKKQRLIEFVEKYSKPETPIKQPASLNILIGKYQQWLKIFPFDLPFFTQLKPHLENQLPILKGAPITNLYSNVVGFKTKTEKELIEFLIELTESILTEINTLTLHKNGTITDFQKTAIDLLNANRNLELKELKFQPKDESRQYIKLLKKWFEGEKKYCNELKQLLRDTPQKNKSRNPITAPAIALFCNYVNASSLIIRPEYEKVETFCKRVCKEFNLNYTDRVRQTYSGSNNKANKKIVMELILPLMDKAVIKKITDYLNDNQRQKQKLYA